MAAGRSFFPNYEIMNPNHYKIIYSTPPKKGNGCLSGNVHGKIP